MRPSVRPLRRAALAALLALAACASEPERRPLGELDYPGTLRPPAASGLSVLWTQRVTAHWPDGSRGFDAALQIHGDELVLLGLSPLGQAGFSIALRGTEIASTNDTGQPLPFPPRFVLLDVERVVFPWIGDELPFDASGAREAVVDDERVRERSADGRLVERSFERLDGRPPGRIVVSYAYDDAFALGPARAELDNGWFGYRLEIETLAETPLDP